MGEAGISRRGFIGAAALAGTAALTAGLAGCGSSASSSASAGAASAAKPVILVVSFGTSYNDSRHITIGAIEDTIAEAFWPDYDVRRAFTAQTIIDKLAKRDDVHIDSFEEAMDRLVQDGVKEVIVQPTHLMAGFEYADVADALEDYRDQFDQVALGEPLLSAPSDYEAVAKALKEAMEPYEAEGTAICLMGHGTEADSNEDYTTMQDTLTKLGYDNYFVATVEATPTFEDVAQAAKAAGYTKAILRPFMVVAGDHANNDMADTDDPESFASIMQAAGFQVESVIEGLGQLDTVDQIYVEHVQAAIDSL